jgi:hypothetical protein
VASADHDVTRILARRGLRSVDGRFDGQVAGGMHLHLASRGVCGRYRGAQLGDARGIVLAGDDD